MIRLDAFRPLPSGRGQMAINWTGEVILQETAKNNLYMQGSKDISLQPEDIIFIYQEYAAWVAAGNQPAGPGAIFCL